MLQYPSVNSWRKSPIGQPCFAFTKYDGSNVRFEYSPKRGWSKYGTRHHLFDKSDLTFAPAIEIFHDTMADSILRKVQDQYGKKVERITAFAEMFGPSSFAGVHNIDEPKTLKLFDIFVFKKGFIPPKTFYELWKDESYSADMIYNGNMTKPFIENVRNGVYGLGEGVVCKGSDWSAKIKTHAWLAELRSRNPGLFKTETSEQSDE